MSEKTLSATEAKQKFLEFVRTADKSYTRYIITHRGKGEAVLMSLDEYEGWLETLEIAANPKWREDLRKAEKESKRGKRLSFEQVTGRKQRGIKG